MNTDALIADLVPMAASAQAEARTAAPDQAARPVLEFATLADLCAEVDAAGPRRYLVRGIWPHGAYGVHAAEPKAQKTWNGSDLAVSVASGTPWLGQHSVDVTGPVVLFVRRPRGAAGSELQTSSTTLDVPKRPTSGHPRDLRLPPSRRSFGAPGD